MKTEMFIPRPHQVVAIDAIFKELEINNKTTAVMACGSGKTLVALWVAEQMNANTILVRINMKTFKNILLATVLSFTVLGAQKELSLEIDEDKILQAIELLQCMEDATFEHQEACQFKDTEYCTCDGDYLALIAYNRIVQAKQLLCDAIEVKLESVDE